ncbi:hypothetical protein OPT61_g9189 [Boeremia exigua]|uniref:Uncharacterized protein n=1 Tax=Boeremia exigua TaxID=749465 RepID=A0ACC2HV61_9PLEO|nr:hypothetical protein OPT61_g9189 [Boeremia exigua]
MPPDLTIDRRREYLAPAFALRADIRTIQTNVRGGYTTAWHEASKTATSKVSAAKREKAIQEKRMYESLKDNTIVSRIPDEATWATPNEVRASKLQPLFMRDAKSRLLFWKEKLTGDVLASHIGRGCAIVDCDAAQPAFHRHVQRRLPNICDLLHRNVIAIQDFTIRMKRHINWYSRPDPRPQVYGFIRRLDGDYRERRPNAPEWQDVPSSTLSNR